LERTDDDIELLRRAVDVQDGVFGIRRQKQREPVLADLDASVVVSVRPAMWTPGSATMVFSIIFR